MSFQAIVGLVIGIGVVVLVGEGLGWFLYFLSTIGEHRSKPKKNEEEQE